MTQSTRELTKFYRGPTLKIMLLGSFLIFLIGVSGIIGFAAAKKGQKSESDYFLATQSVSPYTLAFSNAATKFSGFMFVGFMGAAYAQGTMVIWLGLGLTIGYCMVYAFAVKRLQEINTGGWALSIGELTTFWNGENRVWLRRFIGLLTLLFLSIYAAAQLKAGGKALQVALDQPLYVGVLLSVVIIVFYCWSGGIRASIWTDTAQIIIMTFGMLLILVAAIVHEGGIGQLFTSFMATAPPGSNEVALIPQNLSIGGTPGWTFFFVGMMGLGACAIGQPHVVIRPMALQTPEDAKKFIIANYIFDVCFVALTIAVGLSTRVILREAQSFDPELSLFLSAAKMLPPVAVGLVLAAVFSSTLSTADSQIISCSATLMRDFPDPPKTSLTPAKIGTLAIALVATIIALFAQDNVLSLVTFAYSGLGASIGSILILRFFNSKISEWGAILVGFAGGATVVVWKICNLNVYFSEALPGFAAAFGVYFLLRLLTLFTRKQGR